MKRPANVCQKVLSEVARQEVSARYSPRGDFPTGAHTVCVSHSRTRTHTHSVSVTQTHVQASYSGNQQYHVHFTGTQEHTHRQQTVSDTNLS